MAEVRVLDQGFAKREGEGWISVPTTVLISDGRNRIIVDPGNNPGLSDILERKSIWPEEIGIVFITHSHLDHLLNLRLFPYSSPMDGNWIYEGVKMIPHGGTIPGTSVEVISTPGHTPDHASLIVPTDEGKVSVCGDLFWWEDGIEQKTDYSSLLYLEDPFAVDMDRLMASRRTILRMADEFIPGHGVPFRVED